MPELDYLEVIFQKQQDLQVKAYGQDPSQLGPEARAQFIKDMVLATTDELHEALAEVGWKPWATSRHLNRDAYLGELVDALHFFVNLCLVAEITPIELFDGYLVKREKNAARQAAGYDGVSSKCPGCGRALDDEATKCRAMMAGVWCDDVHELVKRSPVK